LCGASAWFLILVQAMKFLLVLVPFAGIACSSMPVSSDPGAPRLSSRKVAAATGGHGTQVAAAASAAAASKTVEEAKTTSVFALNDDGSPTLRGKHRHNAAATSGHGTQVAVSAYSDQ